MKRKKTPFRVVSISTQSNGAGFHPNFGCGCDESGDWFEIYNLEKQQDQEMLLFDEDICVEDGEFEGVGFLFFPSVYTFNSCGNGSGNSIGFFEHGDYHNESIGSGDGESNAADE